MFTTLASRTIPRATLRALPRAVQVEAMPRRFNSQSAGGPEDPAEPSRNVRPRSERKAEKPALVKAKFAELAKASNPSAMVNARFRDVKGIDPKLVKAIPFQHCSEVQAATLPDAIQGHDILAQAKTGTGKTLAFVIPAIQTLLKQGPPSRTGQISAFILSPTRELAQQIDAEIKMILARMPNSQIKSHAMVGGTSIGADIKKLKDVNILVATPGRAVDLLNNGLGDKLSKLSTFVLDEADRLLDQGFRKDLTTIISALPDRDARPRQTLLFSATMPKGVQEVAAIALDPTNHKFISTLKDDDDTTHAHVKQEIVMSTLETQIPSTLLVVQREMKKFPNAKVMVFLPTARAASLYNHIFAELQLDYPTWEVHSRLSQSRRTKTVEEFKNAPRGVLFSSDVVARGIDIKDITTVVQTGMPSDPQQYIHRLGRTARAGAEGHGVLVLGDFEDLFLRKPEIRKMNLTTVKAGSEAELTSARAQVDNAVRRLTPELISQAYTAFLGYYKSFNSQMKRTSPELAQLANKYACDVLAYGPQPPPVESSLAKKMGFRHDDGLRIVKVSVPKK